MEGCDAPDDLQKFITPNTHHIYAIGSQECLRSIQKSFIISNKKTWEEAIQATLGPRYVQLKSETLVAIHIVVFVRSDVAAYINGSTVESNSVATGALGGNLGNKGGVGVGFILGPPGSVHSVSFLFLSAHFAAHQSNIEERNKDYATIVRDIKLGSKGKAVYKVLEDDAPLSPSSEPNPLRPERDVTSEYDCVFFMGDFNYRVNGTRFAVEGLLDSVDPDIRVALLNNDQLGREIRANRVFQGFKEPEVNFLPTYKFSPNQDSYETAKMRIPSWTDRVLFKQHPTTLLKRSANQDLLAIIPNEYTSIQSMRNSDHRPVRACFHLHTPLPEISPSKVTVANTQQSSTCAVM
eukprot:TRINITY_DN42622_c0_g1_i1.p1 TRINITY_DN42622_c0_g1~~TRINITY_DN42622_c0_g1_i1.p1  ORF type:complete len:372 (+),score=43.79 TRINITY_DN42622_c0_g1_i1:64-1116(+)